MGEKAENSAQRLTHQQVCSLLKISEVDLVRLRRSGYVRGRRNSYNLIEVVQDYIAFLRSDTFRTPVPVGPMSPAMSGALGGAAAARHALGLPADPERDACLARGIEAMLGGYAGSASAATEAEEFARGAEGARRVLGK